jgi:hypothetical protein
VIVAAALVPHPPLLLRELGGREDPVADLRAAAVDAVSEVVSSADEVVVLGAADEAREWQGSMGFDLRRFGTTHPRLSRPGLPLSLGVGSRLLREAGWNGDASFATFRWLAADDDLEAQVDALSARERRTAVLLLGDGSARRSEWAPGYLDERAFSFDDDIAKALADGDATALEQLDVGLAAELMTHGAGAFRLLGRVAQRQPERPRAVLGYRDDPFGVSYFVATWTFERAVP